jgi:transcription elongation factor Elf1
MKVVTELVEEYREIWAVCPKCCETNYVGKVKKDSEQQKGEASCKNCSALYKWQEVKE